MNKITWLAILTTFGTSPVLAGPPAAELVQSLQSGASVLHGSSSRLTGGECHDSGADRECHILGAQVYFDYQYGEWLPTSVEFIETRSGPNIVYATRYLRCEVPGMPIQVRKNGGELLPTGLDPGSATCTTWGYFAVGNSWNEWVFTTPVTVEGIWRDPVERVDSAQRNSRHRFDGSRSFQHCVGSYADRVSGGGITVDGSFYPFFVDFYNSYSMQECTDVQKE
ncbi:MAG: hypothetical protein EPO25_09470 [Gammaproteobacteria bacterium]|nr:MAG: hypothetical protein EPO25_09470 [Gammaproteobacteria bacterium]